MKPFTMVTLLLSLTGMTPPVAAEGEAAPDKFRVHKKPKDAQGKEIELKLHIFEPPNHRPSDKSPAIFFFFGGGWKQGTPTQFYPHCAHLAARGMVAISAEYRIESAHGTTPAECVKDAKSALRWLRRHATELGIDPDRLAAGGGSAGGHLAAATAAAKGFDEADEDAALPCRPNALVLFNPVLDNGPEGYSHERFKDFWRDVSPMHNIDEKTPPTIVFLGSKDALIPVASVEKYKKLMEAKGRRCELRVYEGRTHGFFNYRNFEDYTKTVEEMDLFLESLGYLKGKPGPKPPTNDAR